jgi:hypothetical protein
LLLEKKTGLVPNSFPRGEKEFSSNLNLNALEKSTDSPKLKLVYHMSIRHWPFNFKNSGSNTKVKPKNFKNQQYIKGSNHHNL